MRKGAILCKTLNFNYFFKLPPLKGTKSHKLYSWFINIPALLPCPNPEGIKDALFYKFRRLTIGQNCSAVCTNQGVIEIHS